MNADHYIIIAMFNEDRHRVESVLLRSLESVSECNPRSHCNSALVAYEERVSIEEAPNKTLYPSLSQMNDAEFV